MPCRSLVQRAFALSLTASSLLGMCGGNAAVQAATPGPVEAPLSSTRLIAADGPHGGVWTVALVITLKGHAHTYWRDPGDAGVPPRFDFAASRNVARADVAYPVPARIEEAGLQAIGYEGSVTFPIAVTLRDPAAPATLVLQVDYAACERICLPVRADLSLSLPPAPGDTDAAAIAAAQPKVPRHLDRAQANAVALVEREERDGAIAWRVRPRAATSDLFAEAPEGFVLSTARDDTGFRVAVVEHPADRSVPDWIRVTLARADGPVEFALAPPP